MILSAPPRLDAKEQDDTEEAVAEALSEEVEADKLAAGADLSTLIHSLSATATTTIVDPTPILTAAVADPIPTMLKKTQQLILLPKQRIIWI